MDRKNFIKKTILSAAGLAAGASSLKAKEESISTYDKLIDQVGFNHIPNSELKTMRSVYHPADTRGHADHGWLNTHHSFSFANYYNPERMNFGVLRVLNDDIVAGGRGFNRHPHDNMEIISIPLQGDLEHKDSMGNIAVIKQGDVQVMSAGTGIYHSEYNKNSSEEVRFLQIWMFPNKKQVTPRYDQISIDIADAKNELVQILSPSAEDAGVWAHQNAWFHIAAFDDECHLTYDLRDKSNGVYAFVLEGALSIEGQDLQRRDGYGIWDTAEIKITGSKDAKLLLMEVPMQP